VPDSLVAAFAVVVGFVVLTNVPSEQRVREKGWTHEQKENASRPVGEKIGRVVGKFGTDFGRGLRDGVKEATK
jgi:hypothetical protein